MKRKTLNAYAKITLKGWYKKTRHWKWECPKCQQLIIRIDSRDTLKIAIRKHLYLKHGIELKENGDYKV